MITSQRHLFNIPDEVAYLNTAYMSPLLNSVVDAMENGVKLKSCPWKIKIEDFYHNTDKARELFSKIVNTKSENIAIISSASYGIQTAANNLDVKKDQNIILLKDQFPSNVYPWIRLSEKSGCKIKFVELLGDVNPTETILNFINEDSAVLSVPNVLWTNGLLIDLKILKKKCDEVGCALVLDLTQSAGAVDIDFSKLKPDFAVVANYKWMLGPYSTAFLYVSEKRFNGKPLEEGWITRSKSENFSNLVSYTNKYKYGAIRFDMGERSNFALLPGVIKAMEQILEWGVKNIESTLSNQNKTLRDKLRKIGMQINNDNIMGPHFISAILPHKKNVNFLKQLNEKNIFLSERGGSLRITPHLWNNNNDFDRLIFELKKIL